MRASVRSWPLGRVGRLAARAVVPTAVLIAWLYVYLVVLMALWVVLGMVLAGWSPVVVTSGSMRPTLQAGDVLLIDEHPAELLAQRAVIVFERPGGELIVHRIFSVEDDAYVTKGDGNPTPDVDSVRPEAVAGTGQLVVPLLGLPVVWFARADVVPLVAWGAMTIGSFAVVGASAVQRLRRRHDLSAERQLPTAQVGLWRVRVLVGVLMIVQFAIDPSRFDVAGTDSGRVPMLAIGLGALGAVNLWSIVATRRWKIETRWAALLELAVDTVLVVFLATAAGTSGIGWVLFALPVIEAAMRFGLVGALVHWMILTVITLGARIAMSELVPGPEPLITELERVLDQLSVLFLVVVPGSYLAEQLLGDVLTQRGATDQAVLRGHMLERVMATGHEVTRLGDLHVSAIVDASLELGFDVADIVTGDGVGPWQIMAVDGDGTLPAPGAAGSGLRPVDLDSSAVLVTADDPEPAESAALEEARLASVVALTVNDEPGARLVLRAGSRDGTADNHRFEALRLLAGQAAVALRNDRLLGELTTVSDELEHQAMHDALTGLPNRTRLLGALEEELRSPDASPILLFLDLDGFKPVNDRLGHEAGDELLKLVATRLGEAVRAGDLVARLGGDEFTVLLQGRVPPQRASELATRIQQRLAEPFLLGQETVSIAASVGIAVAEAGIDQSELLRRADVAMYRAKKRARGSAGYVVYDQELDVELGRRAQLAVDLATAVDDGSLTLLYQPVIDVAIDRLVGVEALIRWTHPVYGPVRPDELIALADDVGIGPRLNRWILHRAASDGARWRTIDPDSSVFVTVNASPEELMSAELMENVTTAIAESGFGPDRLFIEISERLVRPDQGAILDNMHALRELGVGLLLDDFGEGQTSLAFLHKLPVVGVKLDRMLVVNSADSETERIVLESIVDLARKLDLVVIAEGVETEDQLSTVAGVGCHLVQGFVFHRPLPASDIDGMVERGRDRVETA